MRLEDLVAIMNSLRLDGFEDEVADEQLRYNIGITTGKVSNYSVEQYVRALERYKFLSAKKQGLVWYILRFTLDESPRDPYKERLEAIQRLAQQTESAKPNP